MYVNENNTEYRPDGKYKKVIQQIAQDGVCPFCPEHLVKYHPFPLEEWKYWWITNNAYPYVPHTHHRLLVSKEHITHILEISPEAWNELGEIIQSEAKKLNIQGGSLGMRFGETRFTGGSVAHLHAHLYQSNPDDPKYDKVKGVTMRIG